MLRQAVDIVDGVWYHYCMSIGNRDRINADHGNPLGMSVKKPQDTRRYYVLALNQRSFIEWVKREKKNLQACTYCGVESGMVGINFTNPEIEMVVISGWADGKGQNFLEAGSTMIAHYCQDKRVHEYPKYVL